MTSPYKRRRPSIVRNFWVYRRLIALAMVLGLTLWFIWANNSPVTVSFPFRLGTFTSTSGLVILLSALVGSVATALAMTILFALKWRRGPSRADEESSGLDEERPPSDYAAKTEEGFRGSQWS